MIEPPSKRRVIQGFGANLSGQIITVVIQLMGVPILLHAWGPQLYGEWLILFAVPAYLSMADLGFSQSAGNDMIANVAHGARDRALIVFQSLGALVYSMSIIGLILVSVLVFSLPLQHWFHFSVINASQARWLLWCLAVEMLVRLNEGINNAGFRANGDYALQVYLSNIIRLVQFSMIWIVALTGGGPVAAGFSFLLVRLIATPSTALLLIHRHAWLRFGFIRARRTELRRLLKPALANTCFPLAQAMNIQGMVLVVGAVIGPLAVVTFTSLRILTRIVVQIVGAVSHAAEPEFAAAFGCGNRAQFSSLFTRMLVSQGLLTLIGVFCLLLLGKPLLEFWTHGKVKFDPMLFNWLLLSAVCGVAWHGALIAIKSTNRHLRSAIFFALGAVVEVALAWSLLHITRRLADAGLALLVLDSVTAFFAIRGVIALIRSFPCADSPASFIDPSSPNSMTKPH